ncbi:MAG: hypothetical protein Q4A32_01750 [Lachnospiraceae bacterium]|nr:hypothetical protein [Lachnospiraceae bacterium]
MKNLQYFPFERNQYYYGKLITQQDFVSEQRYMNDKRRLINRFLHGAGIVAGLQVVRMDDRSFSLEAGLALDETGREILVDKPSVQRLDRLDGYDALLERSGADMAYLCISFDEKDAYPSRTVLQTDDENRQVYEKCREGFRLYLTSAPFEEDGDTVRSFCERSEVLFENADLLIMQYTPAFAQGGERFEIRIQIRAKRPIKEAEISFEEQLTCLIYRGEEKLQGEWSGSLKEQGDFVDLSFQVEAYSITQGIGEIYLAPYRLKVKLGDRHLFSRTAAKAEIQLSSKDPWQVLLDRYYNGAMNKVLSTTAPRGIYLAAIYLKQSGREYLIDRISPVPFDQWVYNSFLNMNMLQLLRSKHLSAGARQRREAISVSKTEERIAAGGEKASGICVIPIGIGGKAGERFFSGEIIHGLGLGAVDIRISLEQGEYQYAGSQEIFEDMAYRVETAVKLNREKGSFIIGIRFLEASAVQEVRIHWIAEKMPETYVKDQEAHIRILPDKPELKVMQSRYFRTQTENLESMTILWEVTSPNGGIITRDGHYTAPDTEGIYEVCAFCQEMPQIRNSVFVIVHE